MNVSSSAAELRLLSFITPNVVFQKSQCLSRHAVSPLRSTQLRACESQPQPDAGGNMFDGWNLMSKTTRVIVKIASVIPIAATLLQPDFAQAREKKTVITMTDQVPNFTLPSQERALEESDDIKLFVRLKSVARTVIPPVAILAIATWLVALLFRKARERQLRDFQAQLKSFSSMLDLDSQTTLSQSSVADSVSESAPKPRNSSSASRKGRSSIASTDDLDGDISSKVRLDLFRMTGQRDQPSSNRKNASLRAVDDEKLIEVVPVTPFEKAVLAALHEAMVADEDGRRAAANALIKVRDRAGISAPEGDSIVNNLVSRFVSIRVDRAVVTVDASDAEVIKRLHELSKVMDAARALRGDQRIQYMGRYQDDESNREELYRRYAVFCLSNEQRMVDEIQTLGDMQRLLSITEQRADTINTEIAKGMFQVAVSAAMADGTLSDEDRKTLENVKGSFGSFLDGDSADSILSEVAVMRAMYSLQQLLQEQGVSAEDVRQLRSMCKELGVDVDEMLQNADSLGDALGPEAKSFVDSLRGVLKSTAETDAAST